MKELPKPIMINTGEEELVSGTIDDFFREIVEHVETHYKVERRYFLIDSGLVSYRGDVISGNRITHLTYRDRVLAGVFENRTEFNRMRYTFFRSLDSLDDLDLSRKEQTQDL